MADVARVVATFYATTTTEQERQACQTWMLTAQRQTSAWRWAFDCLGQTQNINVQFFGAQTLQVKLARDWESLSADEATQLRETLIKAIVHFSEKPSLAIVMRKLCLALTAYAQKTVPHLWHPFIPSLFKLFEHQCQTKAFDCSHGCYLQTALLEILTVCPEEFQSTGLSSTLRIQLTQELLDAIPTVLSFLQHLLSLPEPQSGFHEKVLQCLLSWLHFGIPISTLTPLLNQVIILLSRESVFEATIQVLCELVAHPSNARFADTICQGLLPLLVSDWAKNLLEQSMREEEETAAQNLAKLMSIIAETFPVYIVKSMKSPLTFQFLELLVQTVMFPGYFGVDQETSDIAFQAFYLIQETLSDPPSGPSTTTIATGLGLISQSTNSSTDSMIDLIDEDQVDLTRKPSSLIIELEYEIVSIYSKLFMALYAKARWPPMDVWRNWNKDKREKWNNFRRDAGDTMIVCYYVLRKNALQIILQLFSTAFNAKPDWQEFEVIMFCLKVMTEAIPADESEYLPLIITKDNLARMPLQSIRLRQTILQLLGNLAEWIKRHPTTLSLTIEFLSESLRDPTTAAAAAKSLKEICDLCRDQLSTEFAYLLSVYQEVKDKLTPNDKQAVVESLSDIIQILPLDQMIEPLSIIALDILHSCRAALEMVRRKEPAASDQVVNQLKILTACCRGIQQPELDDDRTSLTTPTSAHSSRNTETILKTQQIEAALELSNAPNASLLNALYIVLEETVALLGVDQTVMSTLCLFIDTTLQSPLHLFHISFQRVVQFVVSTFTRNNGASGLKGNDNNYYHACIIDTASCVVSVFGERARGAIYVQPLRDMVNIITSTIWTCFNSNDHQSTHNQIEEFPDAVSSFFRLISNVVRYSPSVLYDGPPTDTLYNILAFSVRCLHLQERLALKATIHFLTDFVTQDISSRYAKPHEALINNVLTNIAPAVIRATVEGITHRSPRSYVLNLSDLLYRLILRLPNEAKVVLCEVFSSNEAVPLLPEDKRAYYLKQLLGTRQMKIFKDTVKELSLKTRGLEGWQYA